jgi:hypothetical protein
MKADPSIDVIDFGQRNSAKLDPEKKFAGICEILHPL